MFRNTYWKIGNLDPNWSYENFTSLSCFVLYTDSNLHYKSGNKKALLIGIGKYPSSGGWSSLNSVNDLQIINDALVTQGFLEANIKIIKDEHCTKENIIKALKHDLYIVYKKGI